MGPSIVSRVMRGVYYSKIERNEVKNNWKKKQRDRPARAVNELRIPAFREKIRVVRVLWAVVEFGFPVL